MEKFMEENLDMCLKDLLAIMQDQIVSRSRYFGISTQKSPLDFWKYQEIIYELEPDFIVEIGNFNGGSTLALAHIFDIIGHGQVIGIDINHQNVPQRVKDHKRIKLITGDACDNFDIVRKLIPEKSKVLVIEDSSHTYENTLNVLRKFNSLVDIGYYFIVEDSICHHGLEVGPKPGPYEAIEQFIEENSNFQIDREKESFLITWNPKGYLKRIK
jgi:cephalosporin hydroxylase